MGAALCRHLSPDSNVHTQEPKGTKNFRPPPVSIWDQVRLSEVVLRAVLYGFADMRCRSAFPLPTLLISLLFPKLFCHEENPAARVGRA